jgi:hypothetical protein
MIKVTIILLLALLLGGVIGIAGGVGLSFAQSALERRAFDTPEHRKFATAYSTMTTLEMLDTKVWLCEDTPNAKRENLLSEFHAIEVIKKNLTIPELLPLVEVQEGIAHGQLALIEQSSGNGDAFVEQMAAARAAFKTAGWTDYSEQAVRKAVAEINKDSGPRRDGSTHE